MKIISRVILSENSINGWPVCLVENSSGNFQLYRSGDFISPDDAEKILTKLLIKFTPSRLMEVKNPTECTSEYRISSIADASLMGRNVFVSTLTNTLGYLSWGDLGYCSWKPEVDGEWFSQEDMGIFTGMLMQALKISHELRIESAES